MSTHPSKPEPESAIIPGTSSDPTEQDAGESAGTTASRRALEATDNLLPKEMTIGQAAEFLDVSRCHIGKLIKRRRLPCRGENNRRRIPSEALVEYRNLLTEKGLQACKELTRLQEELGLYDWDEDLLPPE